MTFSPAPVLGILFDFALAMTSFSRRLGPLAILQDWIQHARAAWLWLSRDAVRGVWERRGRYDEWLWKVRSGRI